MSCDRKYSVALPHGAVGWPVLCNYGRHLLFQTFFTHNTNQYLKSFGNQHLPTPPYHSTYKIYRQISSDILFISSFIFVYFTSPGTRILVSLNNSTVNMKQNG